MRSFLPTILAAALPGLLCAQTSAPVTAKFAPYGPSCGLTLDGTDDTRSGQHRLDFAITGAVPSAPVLLLVGTAQINVPYVGCNLLVLPLASATAVANASGQARFSFTIAASTQGRIYAQAWSAGVRASDGLGVDFAGRLEVFNVTPLTAREGDLITIIGRNFDPAPENNCVFLADMAGSARVISASPTQLVARVEAVAQAKAGDVSVVIGQGQALPSGPMMLGGLPALVQGGCTFRGHTRADGGLTFQLVPASPNTVAVTESGGAAATTLPMGSFSNELRVEAHVHCCGCEWFDDEVRIQPLGTWNGLEAARAISDYFGNHIPQRVSSWAGTNVSWGLTHGPIDKAFGTVSTR